MQRKKTVLLTRIPIPDPKKEEILQQQHAFLFILFLFLIIIFRRIKKKTCERKERMGNVNVKGGESISKSRFGGGGV